jgi:uncharacterized protein YhaN
MQVRTLRVHGFGRLADRDFQLGPGLTIVHGPNEAGKSTLHAALTASLMGLVPGGRRNPSVTAVVERYRPWTHDRYGSRLDLESSEGRRLRLDWDFGRWTFSVTDAATGEDITSACGAGTDPEELCRALYGVSRDAYLRVGCIRQGELTAVGESTSVRRAIERVADQTGDEGAAGAVEALRRQRASVVGLNRSRTNPLPRASERVRELAEELEQAEQSRQQAEQAAAERDRLRLQADELERRQHELEMAQAAARARSLRRRVERAREVDRERRRALALVEHGSGTGWQPVEGLAGARERALELERRMVEEAPRLAATRDALSQLDEGPEPRSPAYRRPPRWGFALAGAGVALAAAGIVMGSLPAVVLGVALAATGGGLQLAAGRAADRRRRASAERERLAAEREAERARLRAEIARVEALCGELEGARARLAGLLGVENDPVGIAAGLEAYDRDAAARGDLDRAAHRRDVAEAELRSLLGERSLEQLSVALAEMEGALNGHRNAPGADRDADDIAHELGRVRRERERAVVEGEAAAARVAERLRALPDTADLRERRHDAEAELERLQRVDAVLRLAEHELAEAASETYRDFAPRLNAALQAQLARVTDGRYRTAYVSDDLSVRLEAPETGAPIDLDRASLGTQKLAYLVQRLELVRLLTPAAEPLPVLLDDPFAHLDQRRMGNALELLVEVASERQLILFTTQQEVVRRAPACATVVELAP